MLVINIYIYYFTNMIGSELIKSNTKTGDKIINNSIRKKPLLSDYLYLIFAHS